MLCNSIRRERNKTSKKDWEQKNAHWKKYDEPATNLFNRAYTQIKATRVILTQQQNHRIPEKSVYSSYAYKVVVVVLCDIHVELHFASHCKYVDIKFA